MAYPLPEWYKQKRAEFEARFSTICTEDRLVAEGGVRSRSPTGNHELEVSVFRTGPDPSAPSWEYSRGVVTRVRDQRVVADVKRNFGHFPFAWVARQETEYLLCGEDYQGYSVINLVEGQTNTYIPDEAERGNGFCWGTILPSPNGLHVVVDGCYWAASYELRLYDFSNPSKLPLGQIAGLSYLYGDPYKDSILLDGRWLDDERIELLADVTKDESEDSVKSSRIWTLREILAADTLHR